jgi:hypothetical protein
MFIAEIFHPPISSIHESDPEVIGNNFQIPQLILVEGQVNYKFIEIERRNCIVDWHRDTPSRHTNLITGGEDFSIDIERNTPSAFVSFHSDWAKSRQF